MLAVFDVDEIALLRTNYVWTKFHAHESRLQAAVAQIRIDRAIDTVDSTGQGCDRPSELHDISKIELLLIG